MTFYWFDIIQGTFLLSTLVLLGGWLFNKEQKYKYPAIICSFIWVIMLLFSPVNLTEKNKSHYNFTNSSYTQEKPIKSQKETFDDRNERLKKQLERESKNKLEKIKEN